MLIYQFFTHTGSPYRSSPYRQNPAKTPYYSPPRTPPRTHTPPRDKSPHLTPKNKNGDKNENKNGVNGVGVSTPVSVPPLPLAGMLEGQNGQNSNLLQLPIPPQSGITDPGSAINSVLVPLLNNNIIANDKINDSNSNNNNGNIDTKNIINNNTVQTINNENIINNENNNFNNNENHEKSISPHQDACCIIA